MEKKKKFYPRENTPREENNGQRISVRPGNFTPPGTPIERPSAPAQGGAQNANGGSGGNGGNGGHHGRNRRSGRNRHGNANRPKEANAPVTEVHQGNAAPAQGAPKQTQGQNQNQNQNRNAQGGGRNRRGGKNRRGGREEMQARKEESAPVLSDSLRRELDADFSPASVLSAPTSIFSREKKAATEEVLDSEEFAVDIATASYLVEDVPSGFPIPEGGKAVEVVGVRFRAAGRIYFFEPNGMKYAIGDRVIVDTARGNELGDVVMLNRKIAEKNVVQPLRAVIRMATKEDEQHAADNLKKEVEALKICETKVALHKLDMRLVDAQYTFDNSKLLFYFTSEGRVDFRDLVRDLASCFHTRIELRQIGIRDEARLVGGLGMCGRPFCCSTFLSDFGQVSVKMAKEQGLSINASKISGCCGRLMCCLRYEQDTYQAEAKLTPKKDAIVTTPDGKGVVVDSVPLLGSVKVKLDGAEEEPPRVYHRDQLTVVPRCPRAAQNDAQGDEPPQEDESEE